MINKIFLSLGSNQGDKIKNLNSAIISIKKFAVINHISNYFLSEAIDVRKQEDFINIALEISTQLSADELLLSIKEIEVSMGRDITKIGEPRVIDIDIIFYNNIVYNTNDIEIPHPRAHKRAFVIYPNLEIDSKFVHPVLKKTIQEISNELPRQKLVKLEDKIY